MTWNSNDKGNDKALIAMEYLEDHSQHIPFAAQDRGLNTHRPAPMVTGSLPVLLHALPPHPSYKSPVVHLAGDRSVVTV